MLAITPDRPRQQNAIIVDFLDVTGVELESIAADQRIVGGGRRSPAGFRIAYEKLVTKACVATALRDGKLHFCAHQRHGFDWHLFSDNDEEYRRARSGKLPAECFHTIDDGQTWFL
ncbi:MAG: hypothetical protein ABSH08_00900 [Tepidisphaeraceae bacterium]|jgi:hypothetical protein